MKTLEVFAMIYSFALMYGFALIRSVGGIEAAYNPVNVFFMYLFGILAIILFIDPARTYKEYTTLSPTPAAISTASGNVRVEGNSEEVI